MLNKIIKYRGIIHERAEDAPFMGALIIAERCNNNCQGCFNQHLKDSPVYSKLASDIIQEVRANPFNDGIILGGLEWSENPEDTMVLIRWAKATMMQVMLYTGLTEDALYTRIPRDALHHCYVKFGRYDETALSDNYTSFGIKLASTNQYIKYITQRVL